MTRYLPADRYENGRLVEDGSVSIVPQRDNHGHPTIRITYMRDVAHVVEQTEGSPPRAQRSARARRRRSWRLR